MYQTQYVPVGLEQKGIGEITPGFAAKKMFPLDYGLLEQEFKFLNLRFPEWFFISHNSGCHDHPVAHTSTKLAIRRKMDSLEKGTIADPKVYFDLNGNPTANEAFMRRVPEIKIITFVELITPKDYVRAATKWGPQFRADGTWRYLTTHIRDIPTELAGFGDCVAGFLSFHTTYYYDPVEIMNLLAWAPGSKYYGVMHKFDGHSGTLNNGEQSWVKSPSGAQTLITQTNVKSGEFYQHPDNSWWYEHDSYCTDQVGMGWTTNMLCDETYVITATGCPPVQCRMSTGCFQIKPLMKTLKHTTALAQTQDQIASGNRVTLSLFGAVTSMDIHPRLVPFFGEMRSTVINKSRNAKNFQDHVSRCKIRAKSLMSSAKLDIDAQQLSDIARFSFFIDFEDQYGSDKIMFDQSYVKVLTADPMYKKGSGVILNGTLSLLTDMLMCAADAKDIKMGVVKAARAGVQHLNRNRILDTL
jgi:hypothetical protein